MWRHISSPKVCSEIEQIHTWHEETIRHAWTEVEKKAVPFKMNTPVPVAWREGALRGVGKWSRKISLGQVKYNPYSGSPWSLEPMSNWFWPGREPYTHLLGEWDILAPSSQLQFKKTWSMFEEYMSEIPCLVTGLPASGATPMKNPAYNGGAQLPKRRGNTVGSRSD